MAPVTASAIVEVVETASAPQRVLVGLVGRGIQLSRTPAMHEAEGRAQDITYVYHLLDTDVVSSRTGVAAPHLSEILIFAEFFGFNGLNITFPYKQEIIPFLDDLSEAAEALGSVNTVVLRGGRRLGHNTDMWGFKQSFNHEMAGARRENVLLLGAGGAGAAVAHALLESDVGHLLISDVVESRSEALTQRLAKRFGHKRVAIASTLPIAVSRVDGIVNASPVGMGKTPGLPLEPALLRSSCWVADVIYFPIETQLLAEARKRGCRTMSGESMAINQAARAFELFTGKSPDVDRMRAAFATFDGEPSE